LLRKPVKIYYNRKLKNLSRDLRRNSTLSEILLWNELKTRKMRGYQFMRQKPIGEYIVDFYCNKLKLVIEIDGESHEGKFNTDITRQHKLESLGLSLLRFNDIDVKRDIFIVLKVSEGWIERFEKNNPLNPPFLRGTKRVVPFVKGNNACPSSSLDVCEESAHKRNEAHELTSIFIATRKTAQRRK
jgi:very-short-patch-repair endonuclease